MTQVRWGLWVRGRIRTTITLGGAAGEELAELEIGGWPRKQRTVTAISDAHHRWALTLGEDHAVSTSRDGTFVAAARDGALRVGRRRFTWAAATDGTRVAEVSAPDGAVVLRAQPGTGRKDAWAILDLDSSLPEPLTVSLMVCAVLLRVDGDRRSRMFQSSSSGSGGY